MTSRKRVEGEPESLVRPLNPGNLVRDRGTPLSLTRRKTAPWKWSSGGLVTLHHDPWPARPHSLVGRQGCDCLLLSFRVRRFSNPISRTLSARAVWTDEEDVLGRGKCTFCGVPLGFLLRPRHVY